MGNQVPTNQSPVRVGQPGAKESRNSMYREAHTRVRTRQHSVVDTITSWFIKEKQQQATKNELKAKQHSDLFQQAKQKESSEPKTQACPNR